MFCVRNAMKPHNKIVIASQLFERAHEIFELAESEADFASSLLLAGAVVGIIAPFLAEQGGHPTHDLLARIASATAEADEDNFHAGLFRAAYNSLKHTGNKRKGVWPSEDLEFEADIEREAAHMLDVAKADFNEVRVSAEVQKQYSDMFIALRESKSEYA